MQSMREKVLETVVRLRHGDLGVNQSAEVGGLVGVALGVTAAVAGNADGVGQAVTNFFTEALGR